MQRAILSISGGSRTGNAGLWCGFYTSATDIIPIRGRYLQNVGCGHFRCQPQTFKTHFLIAHSDNLHGVNMAEEIKKGDVVMLKSGGPRMTVSQVGEDQYGEKKVWCVWFDRTTKHDDDFEPEALKKIDAGGSPLTGTVVHG
jgi:uncharacterized protein YodC (DUF2158 family)